VEVGLQIVPPVAFVLLDQPNRIDEVHASGNGVLELGRTLSPAAE
jgi:hypothetical protein